MTRVLALVALAAACASGFAVARGDSAATAAAPTAARQDAIARSATLATTPALERLAADATIPAATARTVATELAAEVPLPAGGTFDGVRWEVSGANLSRTEIAGVLQYNAACQWLRAWRDGRERAVSEQVLATIPSWPAWRGTEIAAVFSQVVADARAGGGPAAAGLLADCDAAHVREAAYAEARELTPTR